MWFSLVALNDRIGERIIGGSINLSYRWKWNPIAHSAGAKCCKIASATWDCCFGRGVWEDKNEAWWLKATHGMFLSLAAQADIGS